jgi:hypothetical protein
MLRGRLRPPFFLRSSVFCRFKWRLYCNFPPAPFQIWSQLSLEKDMVCSAASNVRKHAKLCIKANREQSPFSVAYVIYLFLTKKSKGVLPNKPKNFPLFDTGRIKFELHSFQIILNNNFKTPLHHSVFCLAQNNEKTNTYVVRCRWKHLI